MICPYRGPRRFYGAALPLVGSGSFAQLRPRSCECLTVASENVSFACAGPQTDGKPVCPLFAAAMICYDCRRSDIPVALALQGVSLGDFSVTSGTLFAWHKLPLKTYLMAIVAVLQRSEGQKHADLLPRPRRSVQDGVRAVAQAA